MKAYQHWGINPQQAMHLHQSGISADDVKNWQLQTGGRGNLMAHTIRNRRMEARTQANRAKIEEGARSRGLDPAAMDMDVSHIRAGKDESFPDYQKRKDAARMEAYAAQQKAKGTVSQAAATTPAEAVAGGQQPRASGMGGGASVYGQRAGFRQGLGRVGGPVGSGRGAPSNVLAPHNTSVSDANPYSDPAPVAAAPAPAPAPAPATAAEEKIPTMTPEPPDANQSGGAAGSTVSKSVKSPLGGSRPAPNAGAGANAVTGV
jgi:hypothetical protein